MKIKTGDYTGSSNIGISEAIANALTKAGEPARIEIVETRSSHVGGDKRYYQVLLSTYAD
ncbi:hypothetical protein [Legionella jamestowniensis]|uniref:Uncharacterized protein n=1 Tax=Legionella jamestowniensis TaxID=455 RepID=A0A0W0UJ53_9GAMM|nr:hypothetical protein [Legionella jamestowniensis]KTD07931.1 hypothetical protein Ljam_2126 [Legionella jamestowniensis]OCH99064.1 hypothetical protein A8135_10000 [Legionella jamestowniensis]SFL64283.1 hypothetical protein SAMN02746073_1252 [Legionella jamestowniensis DSM 19215]